MRAATAEEETAADRPRTAASPLPPRTRPTPSGSASARRIATARFEGRGGQRHAHMTVSIGIASFPDHCRDAEGLVDCADKALYLAKRMGKNRVETYS